MAPRSDELGSAIADLRDRVALELHPVLDALADDTSGGKTVEEAWHQIIQEALAES